MPHQPAWKRRFTSPAIYFPRWSLAAPDRLVYISNQDGSAQAWSWDRATGERRRVSDERIGVEEAFPTQDGSGVVWFHDATGDEHGRWVVAPFEGGEPHPLVEGVPDGYNQGLALAPGRVALSLASDDGEYLVYVAKDGAQAELLARRPTPFGVGTEWENQMGGLSADGGLLCLRHSEQGDINHFALRVVDPSSGETVGEQLDEGRALRPGPWSPVAGDHRLALVHELEEFERPAIWDLATGERKNLRIAVPGAVTVADWWPDGSALLLVNEHEGRNRLLRFDLRGERAEPLTEFEGMIVGGEYGLGACVRPNGDVWFRASSGAQPPRIRSLGGRGHPDVLAAAGDPAPIGRAYRSFAFANPRGERIHGFVVEPPGKRPHPIVMKVHGGPDWLYADEFHPGVQAFVDHGYAVAMVNYRGSTGYGVAFRNALRGNIGFPEVEDTMAGLDALIEEGVADPDAAVIEGWSWGGYVTLLALGIRPDRWVAGIGGIPVGDYIASHEDCSPPQQAYDLATLGGGPDDLPELYRERSPITYVEQVRAPVLIIAGENDSRCPIRQVRNYVDALRAAGGDVRTHIYDAGHHANQVAEELRHVELELAFLADHAARSR